ncbi:MAG: hypothetical protein ACI932_002202, partial [Paracoccaceae bacterium]
GSTDLIACINRKYLHFQWSDIGCNLKTEQRIK